MIDLLGRPGLGLVVASVSAACLGRRLRLADVIYVIIWKRAVVEIERERRVTLVETLRHVRPATWFAERTEYGYQRLFGHASDSPVTGLRPGRASGAAQ